MNILLPSLLSLAITLGIAPTSNPFEVDTIETSGGKLAITFIGHSSLLFTYKGKTLYLDPWTQLADYTKMPKADIIAVTHEHRDHLDPTAIAAIRTDKTVVMGTANCAAQVPGIAVMQNGDTQTVAGIAIEAVPAYNLVHKRENGQPFHPKGAGNGYVLTFGDTRVYVAGDTESIPEMKNLQNIAIAFLPMNMPYTMTPAMAADAARMVKPRILYPYHFGDTDVTKLTDLLGDQKEIEVRGRKLS